MNNKKKMLIVHRYLNVGGIERSLISFVENLKNDFEIDVLLVTQIGNVLQPMLNGANILYYNSKALNLLCAPVMWKDRKKFFSKKEVFNLFILKCLCKIGLKNFIYKMAINKKFNCGKNYDIVLSFSSYGDETMAIANKFNNSKLISLVHGDPMNQDFSKVVEKYGKITNFICVSKSCAKAFKEKYPSVENVDYLYNFANIHEIIEKQNSHIIDFDKKTINILSVSRLYNKDKAYDRSLRVLKRLIDHGKTNFCWNIVGDGVDREFIENYIKENNMQKFVKLYGSQFNPYPYMKAADLFYLGSYHEAAPMVYAESMYCETPVLTTNTRSAKELIGEYGFVCENNEKAIYDALKEILDNPKLIEEKRKLLKNYKYDNDAIKEKFINIVNSYYGD